MTPPRTAWIVGATSLLGWSIARQVTDDWTLVPCCSRQSRSPHTRSWVRSYCSSDHVFGAGGPEPFVETSSRRPNSVYGHTRVEAEELVRARRTSDRSLSRQPVLPHLGEVGLATRHDDALATLLPCAG